MVVSGGTLSPSVEPQGSIFKLVALNLKVFGISKVERQSAKEFQLAKKY